MRSSVFLLCVMGLSLTQIEFSTSDLVKQTCKHTPNYDLCVKTLLSDPRSSHADVAGLAMVMVDVIKAKTIATLHRISELLGTTRYPKTKAALRRCVELYDNAVLKADLPSAMQALKTGVPKFAEEGTNDAANEADSCERTFSGASPITSFNRADLVDQTCKQTPNYDLCVKTLRADPRSSTADVTGLALVTVDAIKAKATATLDRINGLLGTTPDPKTKAALSHCGELYDNAVLKADIPSAIEALKKGNPKFAEQGVNDAANEADSCERAFGGASPITSFNRSVSDLSRVASAIIGLLS